MFSQARVCRIIKYSNQSFFVFHVAWTFTCKLLGYIVAKSISFDRPCLPDDLDCEYISCIIIELYGLFIICALCMLNFNLNRILCPNVEDRLVPKSWLGLTSTQKGHSK